jgi:hypothetical protein
MLPLLYSIINATSMKHESTDFSAFMIAELKKMAVLKRHIVLINVVQDLIEVDM